MLNRQQRIWFLIALIAIGMVLVLMLVPHVHSGDSTHWLLPLLPILFLGFISPLSLLLCVDYFYDSHPPDAPPLPKLFQRPPPFLLA